MMKTKNHKKNRFARFESLENRSMMSAARICQYYGNCQGFRFSPLSYHNGLCSSHGGGPDPSQRDVGDPQ